MYVCVCSVAESCPTLYDPMACSTPGLPVHHQLWSLFKFMSIESVMLSNHLILCCPLPLWTSICPSIRAFSNELALCMQKNLFRDLFEIFCIEKYFPSFILLCFSFFFFSFWLHHEACRILVPLPGIKSCSGSMESTPGLLGKSQSLLQVYILYVRIV